MKKNTVVPKFSVLFFERPLVDLRKFAFRIAAHIREIAPSVKMASVSIELPDKEERSQLAIDYFYHRDQIKNIDRFLRVTGVKMIVFTNPRIPDMEFMLHAKRLGIKTVLLQEGVIFDGANINDVTLKNIISVFGFWKKTVYYFRLLKDMCRYDGQSYFRLLCNIVQKRKGITQTVSRSFSVPLICDDVLTMGSHWNQYYTDTMGYPAEHVHVIGDHDMDGFSVGREKEKAVCYIATVLVEDGTVKRKDFDAFIQALSKAVDCKTKLYIKLHPRSDIHLYDMLQDHNIEFIRNSELPCVNLYIGHRSTLIGRALYDSDNLIIWKFPKDIKDFYEQYAAAICRTDAELKRAVKKLGVETSTNKKAKIMNSVYYINPNGALKTAAEFILDKIQDKPQGQNTEDEA